MREEPKDTPLTLIPRLGGQLARPPAQVFTLPTVPTDQCAAPA